MVHDYHLRLLDSYPTEVSDWPASTPFHSERWAKLVKQSLGIETMHAGLMDGNALVAYLPYQRGGILGRKIRSGPAVANYSPSLIFDEKLPLESAIFEQLLAQRHPDVTTNVFSSDDSGISIFNLELSGSFEEYWQERVHGKAKYDVRKADKHEIKTLFLDAEACHIFYSLYLKRMQELGSPALPIGFFRLLSTYFKKEFSFAVSFKNDTPVAASTLLGYRNFWIGHPWSVSDSAFRHISVNYAHYRDLIKHAFDTRYARFYLGPSLRNSNWSRIKIRFGGQESFAVRIDGKTNTHASESAMVKTVQAIIARLPVPILRLASPTITKLALKLLG